MFEIFTDRARRVIVYAKEEAEKLMQPFIDTEHLLLGLLREKTGLASEIFVKHGKEPDELLKEIRMTCEQGNIFMFKGSLPFSPTSKSALDFALEEAKLLDHKYVNSEHILLGLLRERRGKACIILYRLRFTLEKVRESIRNYNSVITGDITQPTPTLDQFGKNLTRLAKLGQFDPVIGRYKEIDRLIQILSRRQKNNAVLLGEPGVGKTAIVEALAMRLLDDDIPEFLKSKKIVSLELGSIVAGTKYRGQFEERLKTLLKEIEEDKNTIIFIDEIHTIIGAGAAEGSIDAANMLKPALARGSLQCIGATTLGEYRKYFEKDSALERRFQTVMVSEPTLEDTIEILKGVRKYYEDYHKVFIPDEVVKEIVYLTDRYMTDRFQPDKSIDIMDEASAKIKLHHAAMPEDIKKLRSKLLTAKLSHEKYIIANDYEMIEKYSKQLDRLSNLYLAKAANWTEDINSNWGTVSIEDVCEVLSTFTGIPTNKLKADEKKKIANIDAELKKYVIGQDEAIDLVSKSIKRNFAGISNPSKPMGSFIFLGPTGVGKTEVAKRLAEQVFGTSDALIRIDMSEYMEKFNVSRLVGAPPGYVGYEEGGKLTEQVRKRPYAVILFDEIEKAHPDITNILLQILDEGSVTDSLGHKVNFKNTIIIMTSNLGTKTATDEKFLGFNEHTGKSENIDYNSFVKDAKRELKKYFAVEFLNRVDSVVYFKPLRDKELLEIMDIQIAQINKRLERNNKKITVDLATKKFLLSNDYPYRYGARPIRRILQEYLEDKISDILLNDELLDKKTLKTYLVDDEVIIR